MEGNLTKQPKGKNNINVVTTVDDKQIDKQPDDNNKKEEEIMESLDDQVEQKKARKKYTVSEKKKNQLAELHKKKKERDAQNKKIKELEAYKAVVENNLMESLTSETGPVLRHLKDKLLSKGEPKTKGKKKTVIYYSDEDSTSSESNNSIDDDEEEQVQIKKSKPVEKTSLKNKKSDKKVKVHQSVVSVKKENINYENFFI